MSDPNSSARTGAGTRRFVIILLGALAVFGVLYVAFLVFFAASAPERLANPADIGDPEVSREGIAVPDGGPLTNEPTQAAPDFPARSLDPTTENLQGE